MVMLQVTWLTWLCVCKALSKAPSQVEARKGAMHWLIGSAVDKQLQLTRKHGYLGPLEHSTSLHRDRNLSVATCL